MTAMQPHRSLDIEVSETPNGTVDVMLKANSERAQRVSYRLQTIGASTSMHKGSASLRANDPVTLATIRFTAGSKWCVSLRVEEDAGEEYSVTRGAACT